MKSMKVQLLAAGGVALVTFLVFSPTLWFDFVSWDDNAYVYQNPYFHPVTLENILHFFTHPYFRSWTPVAFVSHGIDVLVWQFNPFGHHLSNVLLHSLNAALVFLLALKCFGAFKRKSETQQHGMLSSETLQPSTSMVVGGVIAALLFALHPLRVESVAWVSDRKDLVCSFFMLLSTIGYFLHVRSGKKWDRWYMVAGLCYLLAMGAKSVAIALPFAWLLMDWLMFKRKFVDCFMEKAPFLLTAAAAAFFARESAPDTGEDHVFGSRTVLHVSAMPFTTIFFYLRNLLLPLNLSPAYHTNRYLPPAGSVYLIIIPLLIVAITIFCIVKMRRGQTSWLLAWSSFVLFLLPTFMGLFTGIQPAADRYTYFASICLCIFVGGGIDLVMQKRRESARTKNLASVVLAVCILAVPLYTYKSVDQAGIWKNSESFWPYVIARVPFALAYNNMGKIHADKKMYDEAIKCFEEAVKLKPAYGEAMNNMGTVYRTMGDHDKAMAAFKRAIEIQPDHVNSYIDLGTEYRDKGMKDSAIAMYDRALLFDSTFAQSHYNIGLVLSGEGKTTEAIDELRTAVSLDPMNADAWYNLGVVLEGAERLSDAETAYSRAIALQDDYVDAYLNLGNIMVTQGRTVMATGMFSKAIALKPSSADAHYNLGYAYAMLGDVGRACGSFQAAIRCDSTYAKAFHNLGVIYQNQGDSVRSIANLQAAARLGYQDSQELLRRQGVDW